MENKKIKTTHVTTSIALGPVSTIENRPINCGVRYLYFKDESTSSLEDVANPPPVQVHCIKIDCPSGASMTTFDEYVEIWNRRASINNVKLCHAGGDDYDIEVDVDVSDVEDENEDDQRAVPKRDDDGQLLVSNNDLDVSFSMFKHIVSWTHDWYGHVSFVAAYDEPSKQWSLRSENSGGHVFCFTFPVGTTVSPFQPVVHS